jgi:hypothetical protein
MGQYKSQQYIFIVQQRQENVQIKYTTVLHALCNQSQTHLRPVSVKEVQGRIMRSFVFFLLLYDTIHCTVLYNRQLHITQENFRKNNH